MYSIQNLIYGVPLTQEIVEYADSNDLDLSELGFCVMHKGGEYPPPGYLGVGLANWDGVGIVRIDFQEIEVQYHGYIRKDDGSYGNGVQRMPLEATPEQRREAQDKWNALPREIKDLCSDVGYYIVESSS